MNRKLIYIIISLIFIVISIWIFAVSKSSKQENYDVQQLAVEDTITDECTEEYEKLKEELEKVNMSQEKISPNCKMILRKIYKSCNHSIDEEIELPQELVNMNQEELEKEYPDWKIENFSEEEIIISKEYEEQCGEHYILRERDGKIMIYVENNEGKEEIFNETDISTKYLTQTDIIKIKNGLVVNGKEELNKILEDYE